MDTIYIVGGAAIDITGNPTASAASGTAISAAWAFASAA